MTNACVVLTTVGLKDVADNLALRLVERRLAACVNIVGPIRSVYRWQGEIHNEAEYLLLIKTTMRASLKSPVRAERTSSLRLAGVCAALHRAG